MNVDLEPTDLWDELLRAGEVAPASDEVLEAARAVLRRAAGNELQRARQRKARRRLRYGVVAAAVVGLLAVGVVRLGGHQASDSAAAATLRRAATATLAQHDPVVGLGQFLQVRLVEQSWGTAVGQDGSVLVGSDGRPAAFEERHTRTVWIPHDTDRDWIVRDGTTLLRSATTDPRFTHLEEPATALTRSPSWARRGTTSYIEEWDPSWYATLSRDPHTLLAQVKAADPGEGHGLAYDFSEIYSEVLRSGLAPAAVRAALFRGLADQPGMIVQGGVTTLDGRHGIAIGVKGGHFAMIFDKSTGLFIGERATDPDFPDVPGLDAAKTTYLTSVTTAVVDHAPKHAKPVAPPG